MADCTEEGEVLSEGELEDGELVSSGEEDDNGDADKNSQASTESPSAPKPTVTATEASQPASMAVKRPAPESAGADDQPEAKKPKLEPNEEDLEDGEIYSDDEEAAYYPQLVKSRQQEEKKNSKTPERPEGTPKKGHKDEIWLKSPDSYYEKSYSKRRQQSPQNEELFYEDREGRIDQSEEGGERKRDSSRSDSYHSSPRHYHGRRDGQSEAEGSSYQRGRRGYHHRPGGQRSYDRGSRYWDHSSGYYVAPGQMNTGMTARQFNALAERVRSRRDRGLSLLPTPKMQPCNNLDQFNYPAPPSWFEEAVKEWEKRQEEAERQSLAMEVNTVAVADLEVAPISDNEQDVAMAMPQSSSKDKGTPSTETSSLPAEPLQSTLTAPPPLHKEPEEQMDASSTVVERTPVENVKENEDLSHSMEISGVREKEITASSHNEITAGKITAGEENQVAAVKDELITPEVEEEFDYDKYLDQLDEEEDEETSQSNPLATVPFTNPLSEDFPLISSAEPNNKGVVGGAKPAELTNQSLKALVGGEIDLTVAADEGRETTVESKRGPATKSARRKQKESQWWARQQKDQQASRRVEQTTPRAKLPCRYFLNGFCRHGDNCQYSHAVPRDKKKEMCRYYLQDSCNKGDNCLFYHGTFPCKYHHTGTYCKHGDKCKFSHASLTPETKELLFSVLEPSKDHSRLPDFLALSTGTNIAPVHHSIGESAPPYSYHPHGVAQPPMVQMTDIYTSNEGARIQFFKPEGASSPIVPITNTPTEDKGLLVSIPKLSGHGSLVVSVPRSKLVGRFGSGTGLPPVPVPEFGARIISSSFVSPPRTFPPPPQSQHYYPPIGQGGPIPLFPPKPTEAINPLDSSGPPRLVLLPTPPPQMKLTAEDIERMKSMEPEYWEAPNLDQCIPAAQDPTKIIGNDYLQHGVSSGPYAAPIGGGMSPRQQPGMEPVPGRMDPRQTYMEPRPGGMDQRQAYMEPRPGGMDQRQTYMEGGMDPRQTYMEPRPGGMDQRQAFMEPRPGGMDQRQAFMEPRPGGMDPRHVRIDPRQPQQNIPDHRMFTKPPMPQNLSTNQFPPMAPERFPLHTDASQPAMIPLTISTQFHPPPGTPHSLAASGTAGQASPLYGHSPIHQEKTSPVWGMSSPEHPSRGAHHLPDSRRVDPRTKYAHLKIKPKNQAPSPHQQPTSHSILKKGSSLNEAGPSGVENRPFPVPKLLQDPTALEKPLDPRELFKGSEHDFGEITAPFGGFKSFFSQSEVKSETSDAGKQQYGEITPVQSSIKHENQTSDQVEEEQDDGSLEETAISPQKPVVPSYLSDLGLGTENDLKIESAFGSLDERTNETQQSQEKIQPAKKLPSIFGFGSGLY